MKMKKKFLSISKKGYQITSIYFQLIIINEYRDIVDMIQNKFEVTIKVNITNTSYMYLSINCIRRVRSPSQGNQAVRIIQCLINY